MISAAPRLTPARDFRLIHGLMSAQRCVAPHDASRGSNRSAKIGLRYERLVWKALEAVSEFAHVEHNPWFSFTDMNGFGSCCPDFLVWHQRYGIIIIEVKLTWVPEALPKLQELYMPVVGLALNTVTAPLVICRTLIPQAPKASFSVEDALRGESPLLHWLGHGRIVW